MSAQNLSRKRPAPGAEPMSYAQQMPPGNATYSNALGPQLSDDQFLQWGQTAQSQNNFQDSSLFDASQNQSAYATNSATPSNQLTRRPANQIATRLDMSNNQWMPEPVSAMSATNGGWEDYTDDLEQKAQAAKREAQTKRKSIPPFVLKLRSFLDDGKNGDLIHWTEDGKSFVVLDEDEFAKKLIPELFKHNNYASFVRQLNMYGFHKRVGLSDNSMRASERKAKSPSEYSNPYFREGYPDLMWLIQKPKNVASGSKGKNRTKSEGENGEDGDDVHEDLAPETKARPRPALTMGDAEAPMPMETLQSVQRELAAIRHQQSQISKMIASIKREHEQLYGQAATFQDQHTRHENSINAILTFLATVYNRSLSGQDANPGIGGIFGAGMPQANQTGNIVDVGDYNFGQFSGMEDMNARPMKRQPLLLTDGQSRAQTMSPKSTGSPYMRQNRRPSQIKRSSSPPNIRQIEELHDFGGPGMNQKSPITNSGQSQQDMMSMIQKANARNASPRTPVADFSDVLHDLENSRGHTPLSSSQRENVLRMMNSSANQSGDNALINTTPPTGPANFDRKLASTKADLDALAKMQAQQNQSVEKLTNLLQPLSPSGSIPGIGDGQNLPPPPMDIEDFLNHNDYFADLPSDGNGNYDFGGTGGNIDGSFDWDANNNDDDELFADLDDPNKIPNSRSRYTAGGGKASDSLGYGLDGTHHDGPGRVESVASSEPTTPKQSSTAGNGNEEYPSTRGKGRKLSTNDDDDGFKRQRKY